MFPFRSTLDGVGRRANKKTRDVCPPRAREKPIRLTYGEVNRVRRVGALSRGRPKKLPWVRAIAAELAVCLPAKATGPKRVHRLRVRLGNGGCRGGVTRPSGSLADWRPGYTRLNATSRRPILVFASNWGPLPGFRAQKVGATTDPRHGCAVNTAERVSRLVRLHQALPSSGVALTGEDTCACARAAFAVTTQSGHDWADISHKQESA